MSHYFLQMRQRRLPNSVFYPGVSSQVPDDPGSVPFYPLAKPVITLRSSLEQTKISVAQIAQSSSYPAGSIVVIPNKPAGRRVVGGNAADRTRIVYVYKRQTHLRYFPLLHLHLLAR